MLQSKDYANYRRAVLFCFFLALCVGSFLFAYGKTGSFIIINGYFNEQLDYFFRFVTVLGDGVIYVPLVVYCILFNRKFLLPVILGIVICTLLTHVLKRVVFPNDLRPISLEVEKIVIHKVKGVPMNRLHSFPSGHTSTAFTMALLLVYTLRGAVWAFALPLIAVLVGYSRVYLAQHFVTDVWAGMGIGLISATLALWLYEWRKGKTERDPRTAG